MRKKIVQIRNPRANRYVKIDATEGKILGMKKSPGPYKGVEIYERMAPRTP